MKLRMIVKGIMSAILMTSAWASLANDTTNSFFDLMYQEDVIKVTLSTNIDFLKSNRNNNTYLDGMMSFDDVNGIAQNWKVEVKPRGKYRRMNCADIPPLKIKLKKKSLHAAGLAEFNDMKLVTQCVTENALAAEYLKKEFLAYKLYNQLSSNSYRVQLLRITYIDVISGKKDKQWGFLIEDTAEMRSRIEAENCEKCYHKPAQAFDGIELKTTALFQYMIGNSDWSLKTARNVKIVKKEGRLIAIPYDFDFSGLVNANYAIPNPNYELNSIQERIYLGFPEDIHNMELTINQFVQEKENLKEIVKRMKALGPIARTEVIQYINDFYKNIDHIKVAKTLMAVGTVDDLKQR